MKEILTWSGSRVSSNLHMESTYSYGYVPFRKRSSWWGSVVVWFMADFGVAATSLSKDALRNCNESMNRNRFHEKDRYRSMFCAITDTYRTKKDSITRQHLTHTYPAPLYSILHFPFSDNLLLYTCLTFYSYFKKRGWATKDAENFGENVTVEEAVVLLSQLSTQTYLSNNLPPRLSILINVGNVVRRGTKCRY